MKLQKTKEILTNVTYLDKHHLKEPIPHTKFPCPALTQWLAPSPKSI